MRSVLAFLVIALALTVPSAYAGPSVKYGNRGGTLSPGPLNTVGDGYRTLSLDDVTNATILNDVVDATIEAEKAAMSVRRAIPLAGALALGARALGPLGVASTLYDLYNGLRCKPDGTGLLCDDGVAADPYGTGTGVYRLNAAWMNPPGSGGFATPADACKYAAMKMGTTYHSFANGECYRLAEGRLWAYAGVNTSGTVTGPACTVGLDGRCPGGALRQLTPEEAAARAMPYADPKKAPGAVRDALRQGIDASPYATPLPAGGPAAIAGPQKTTTNSKGEIITEGDTYNITYSGDSYTYNITNTTTNNTTGETTTTTQQPKTECGVPGKPPCAVKVDEEGTPTWKDRDGSGLDALKAAEAAKRDELMGQVPQPDLGWFGAPPIAECAPFEFPDNMGSLNPCGVVNQTREVMAYLWALAAAWLSFGMIRKAATGGS